MKDFVFQMLSLKGNGYDSPVLANSKMKVFYKFIKEVLKSIF
jgi:hypothetical protein